MLSPQDLNAEEVASRLHIGRNAVYALAKSGELPSYRLGRKLLFSAADVEAYREGKRTFGAAEPSENAPGKLGAAPSPALLNTTADATADLPSRRAKSAGEPLAIAGLGIPADLFVERLEQSGIRARRLGLESYTALVALYEGSADAALVHLYDRRTNSYNVPYVQRLAPGLPVVVYRLVERWQGFAVAPGNPLNLASWGALLRDGVRLANRGLGCGSRILLDEKLVSMEANFATVAGYDHVYPSGLAAAEAVAAGKADVAVIGEQVAAQVTGIDFIPLQKEQVDLVVSKAPERRFALRALRETLANSAFQAEYARIVHGNAARFGSIVYEC
ncbi:MAG: helix-turn-helix transcriptional regulator [Eggerthellaceae bacterium]|nr:helix-turn-helix transcriptional regulator [Eggerthellaceae bacterium]